MRTPSLARKAGSHVIVCHTTGLQPCGGESDRHFRQDKTRHFLLFLTANFHVAKIQLKIHQNRIYFTYLTTIFTFSTLITYPNHPTPWGRPLSRIAIPHFFTPSTCSSACNEIQIHIFLPTSTCPSACRDARSERPGNFVYNQSETDFLICRTLRPSVPTESGALCRTHAKTKHHLSQRETWPFTTRNATFYKTKCGKRRCRLPHSTLWFAKIKPINGFRSVYGS